VDFGKLPPTGTLVSGEPLLRTAGGETIGRRFSYQGNTVCAFGFYLGIAHEPLWGLNPEQDPRDALVPIYEELARAAGVDRPILAPHNLRVYLATDGKTLLIRERAGLPTDAEVALRLPEGVQYPDLRMERGEDGYTRFQVQLAAWNGKWWKAR